MDVKTFEQNFEDFVQSVKYFKKNRDPVQLIEDINAFQSLLKIKYLIHDELFLEKNTDWSCLLKYQFDQILTTLFSSLSESCDTFRLRNYDYDDTSVNLNLNQNDKAISILVFIIQITYNLTQMPALSNDLHTFNERLIDNKIIEVLLEFFDKETFLNEYNKTLDIHQLMISIVKIFKNFSEHNFLTKKDWSEFNMEKIFVNFSKKCRLESQFNKELNFILSNLNDIFSLDDLLKIIRNSDEPGKALKNYETYCLFLKLFKLTQTKKFDDYERILEEDFFNFFISLLHWVSENRFKIDFEDQTIELSYPKNSLSSNENRLSILFYLTSIINSIYQFKSKRKDELIVTNNKIFYIYLNLLSDKELVLKMLACPVDICYNLIEFIYMVSRNSHNEKFVWSELKVYDTLYRLAKILLKSNDNQLNNKVFLTYWILCFIKSESFLDTENFVLVTMDIFFKQLDPRNKTENFLFGLKIPNKNIINCLRRLSLNDKIKWIIYEKFDIIKHYIYEGDDKEKFYSLRLLIQLCFDEGILEDIHLDEEFCDFMKSFYEIELSKNSKLFHSAEWVLWVLNLYNDDRRIDINRDKMTLMISFDKCDEGLFLKLVKKLENYDIDILSSQNNSCCKNIEACDLCVVFVNEKYRLNEYCQIEARYVNFLGKQIIRVNTQEGFEQIDGWISTAFKDKYSLNLYGTEYDKSIKILLNHIKSFKIKSNDVSAIDWSVDQVGFWLKKNNINDLIIKNLGKIDGKVLKEIYKIKCESVDFFYERILAENSNKIKMADIALFRACLEDLFGDLV